MKIHYCRLILLTYFVLSGCTKDNDTIIIVPPPPTNLNAIAQSTTEIKLDWTDVSTNEDGYKIERKGVGGTYAVVAMLGKDQANYLDNALQPNTLYTYRVYGFNQAGNSPSYSNEASATTKDPVPLPATELKAQALSESRISIEWKDNSVSETGYKIERKSGAGTFTLVTTIAANSSAFNDEGLTPNTEYTYRVFPFNNAGNASYSNEASATTHPDIKTGLLLFLPFTGNVADSSGNNMHGTLVGASPINDRWNRENKAYSFNGTSNYIRLPLLTSLNGLTQYSFSFWINTDFQFNYEVSGVFSHWITTSTPGGPIGLNMSLRRASVTSPRSVDASMQGGVGSLSSPNLINDNTWTHITVIFDGTRQNVSERLTLYVNGEFKENFGDSDAPTSLGTNADMTVVGASVGYVGGPLSTFFKGALDEIRLYNRKLTEAEIRFLRLN